MMANQARTGQAVQSNDVGGGANGVVGSISNTYATTVKRKEVGDINITKKKSIQPSASSICLELLERRRASDINNNSIISGTSCSATANTMNTTDNGVPTQAATGKQHHKIPSVVPQLMDIYSDLAQSSTPQTTTVLAKMIPTQLAPPLSTSATSLTQTTKSTSTTTSQSSIIKPSLHTSSSVAALAEPANKKAKTNDNPSSTGRKKEKSSDKRWSKRFVWPDELHRDFVSAIFEVGLKNCSPSSIIEHMQPNPDVTSERLKSHLQKYRLNRQKSHQEFMDSYDKALDGFRKQATDLSLENGEEGQQEENVLNQRLACGEAAALCTHADITGIKRGSCTEDSRGSTPVAAPSFHMPSLTRQEYDGPIGQTFRYMAGLHRSMLQQLDESRRQRGGGSDAILHPAAAAVVQSYRNQPMAHVYNQPQQNQQAMAHPVVQHAAMHANDQSIHEVAATVPQYIPLQPPTQPPQQGDPPHAPILVGQHSLGQGHPNLNQPAAPQPVYQQQQQQQTSTMHQDIPTISHHPVQSAFIPTNSSHTNQPMNYPSAPQAAAPRDTSTSSNNPIVGGGRTLQAQKESTIMKQEMQGQMNFQNKIRQLKQIELSKYSGTEQHSRSSSMDATGQSAHVDNTAAQGTQNDEQQLASMSPPHDNLNLFDELDILNPDDDDQIFDFLME